MARVFTENSTKALTSGNTSAFDLTTAFSIAFWIYRTGTPAADRRVISADDGNTDSGWFLDLQSSNIIQAVMVHATTNKKRNTTTTPTLNDWTHVVVVHTPGGSSASTDWTFYVDGASEAGTHSDNGSGAHTAQAVPYVVGAVAAMTAGPYNMGPVSFYDRAISGAEAAALAGGDHPQSVANCIEAHIMDGATSTSNEVGLVIPLTLTQSGSPDIFDNPPIDPLGGSAPMFRGS